MRSAPRSSHAARFSQVNFLIYNFQDRFKPPSIFVAGRAGTPNRERILAEER